MTRSRKVLVALAALLATFASLGVAAPAQADIGILGCQASTLYVYPVVGPPYPAHCSGTYNVSINSRQIVTNGWSGYFILDGTRYNYCDFQTWSFSPYVHVSKVWLSATRTSWC